MLKVKIEIDGMDTQDAMMVFTEKNIDILHIHKGFEKNVFKVVVEDLTSFNDLLHSLNASCYHGAIPKGKGKYNKNKTDKESYQKKQPWLISYLFGKL